MREQHVPTERLQAVAEDNLIFTREEFNHLKACSQCFTDWRGLIHQLIRETAAVGCDLVQQRLKSKAIRYA
jgi:hypothetical protein